MDSVLGFAFSTNKKDILLIKNVGLYDVISTPLAGRSSLYIKQAFKEQTGIFIDEIKYDDKGLLLFNGWQNFAILNIGGDHIHCYRAFTNLIYQCTTKDAVSIHKASMVPGYSNIVDYIPALISIAVNENFSFANLNYNIQ